MAAPIGMASTAEKCMRPMRIGRKIDAPPIPAIAATAKTKGKMTIVTISLGRRGNKSL